MCNTENSVGRNCFLEVSNTIYFPDHMRYLKEPALIAQATFAICSGRLSKAALNQAFTSVHTEHKSERTLYKEKHWKPLLSSPQLYCFLSCLQTKSISLKRMHSRLYCCFLPSISSFLWSSQQMSVDSRY